MLIAENVKLIGKLGFWNSQAEEPVSTGFLYYQLKWLSKK